MNVFLGYQPVRSELRNRVIPVDDRSISLTQHFSIADLGLVQFIDLTYNLRFGGRERTGQPRNFRFIARLMAGNLFLNPADLFLHLPDVMDSFRFKSLEQIVGPVEINRTDILLFDRWIVRTDRDEVDRRRQIKELVDDTIRVARQRL